MALAGGGVVGIGAGFAGAKRIGDVEDHAGGLRLVEFGEGRRAVALAPRGAEGDLRIEGLPAEAEFRDGGVFETGVAVVLGAAGGVEFEDGEEREFLRGRGERDAQLGIDGLHAARALRLRHRQGLVEELILRTVIAEALFAPLGAGRETEVAGGKFGDGAGGHRVERGEFGERVARAVGHELRERGGVVGGRAAVVEEIERGGAVGVGERGVDGGLRNPAGDEGVVRGRAVVERGGVP